MENIFLGFIIGGTFFSIIALFSKDTRGFIVIFVATIILSTLWLIFGGMKRIKIYFKVRNIMNKIPKNVTVLGFKETADLLGFNIEYLQNLNYGFAGFSIQPKAYIKDISLNKTSFTRQDIKQLAYFKFSEFEGTQSKSQKTDYLER